MGVQLETAAENTFVESLLDEAYATGGDGTLSSGTDSWLGGNRASQGAALKWTSGQNVATAVQDFPDGFDPSEDANNCLQTYRNGHDIWRWYTANCNSGGDNAYTCEMPVASSCKIENGFDYPGSDIDHVPNTASWRSCQVQCSLLSSCTHWTYNLIDKNVGEKPMTSLAQ